MLGKAILWISAVVFSAYGLACLYSPQIPADYAGLVMSNADAFAEIGAMYGGLQLGFGIFCLLGALRPDFFRPALTALVLMIGALALSRLYWTVMSVDAVGLYTHGALVFEFTVAVLAAVALRKT